MSNAKTEHKSNKTLNNMHLFKLCNKTKIKKKQSDV